jgi:uncharacterized membrane protein YphA (DoxX/SURF4 family)
VLTAFCKDWLGPLSLRLALGLVCVYHGFLKIRSDGGAAWFPTWPVGWQLVVAWGELAAGLAIIIGFRCRLAALTVLSITIGSFVVVQGRNTFQLPLAVLETTVMLGLVGLALIFVGAGNLSLDGWGGGKMPANK